MTKIIQSLQVKHPPPQKKIIFLNSQANKSRQIYMF